MLLTQQEKDFVKQAIAKSLRAKFKTQKPQSPMPFQARLLGKNRVALYSFIQGINTAFGMSIYEQVAETLAKTNKEFLSVERGKTLGGFISAEAEKVINQINRELQAKTRSADASRETEEIRRVCRKGGAVGVALPKADIYVVGRDGCHYPMDIKTTKPNKAGFQKMKDDMLRWTAAVLYEEPKTEIAAMLGMPYNPNYPKPYEHWTVRGVVEKGTQLKMADEFWDFLAGKPVFDSLLDCFEEVGIEMREEIDECFARFRA